MNKEKLRGIVDSLMSKPGQEAVYVPVTILARVIEAILECQHTKVSYDRFRGKDVRFCQECETILEEN